MMTDWQELTAAEISTMKRLHAENGLHRNEIAPIVLRRLLDNFLVYGRENGYFWLTDGGKLLLERATVTTDATELAALRAQLAAAVAALEKIASTPHLKMSQALNEAHLWEMIAKDRQQFARQALAEIRGDDGKQD